jgi:hypothetical protein
LSVGAEHTGKDYTAQAIGERQLIRGLLRASRELLMEST